MTANPADCLRFLNSRISVKGRDLTAPGPSADEMEQILTTALRVPDHGNLQPWRIVLLTENGRAALNQAAVTLFLQDHPGASELALEKEKQRFSHAPTLLAVASVMETSVVAAIPPRDQLLSGGALCMNVLYAAHALGYTGSWITGWPAYHRAFPSLLGLPGDAEICGFIYLGTAKNGRKNANGRDGSKLFYNCS